jgi:BNR repeat-like domain
VAVQPGNPNALSAAWQQDRWGSGAARAMVSSSSLDGGLTWQRTLHPFSRCGGGTAANGGDYERASDPWVDIGPDGTLHAMALAVSGSALQPGSVSAMLAQRSRDGGRSWEPVQTLVRDVNTLFHDKNTLTADRLDARFVYAVWDRLDGSGAGPTLLARSVNGGASWEPARVIYEPRVAGGVSQTIGNRVVVLDDGSLLNVFTQIDTVGGLSSNWLGVIRSTDKGATWSAPVRVADQRPVGARDPQNAANVIRDGAILPVIAVGGGRVWVAWQDGRESSGARDAILLSSSSDNGQTWSAPRAVNKRADVAAFTPALWVRADGVIGLNHFDLRDDTSDAATLLATSWLLTSHDGGQTWREAKVVGPFDLAPAPQARGLFIGDYMGLVSRGEQFLPVLALSQNDATNRTEVFALATLPAAAFAAHTARPVMAADNPALRNHSALLTRLRLQERLQQ